jgi:hypothetical protein
MKKYVIPAPAKDGRREHLHQGENLKYHKPITPRA